jgi:chemotaxis protein MotB
MRRRHEEHDNLERWLVSYADFITLMFAFFTVLWATSQADQEKLQAVVESMNAAFSGGMSSAIRDTLSLGTHETGLKDSHLSQDAVARPEIRNLMQNLSGSLSDNTVQVGIVDQQLTVVLPESLLFATGSADLHPVAFGVLGEIAGALAGTPARIEVLGHADGLPLPPSSPFTDNWGLATARAAATVRYLAAHGLRPEQMAASGTTTREIDPGARAVTLRIRVEDPKAALDVMERLDASRSGVKVRRQGP